MYTLINGSPKTHQSNSEYFLNKTSKYLDNYKYFKLNKDNYKLILKNIKKTKTIILAFPLYIDSPTSITLSFLDYIIDNNINLKNKSIYLIINCGFREGKQNITALNIIKNWCKKVNASYKGSLLIGAGEIVGKPKYNFISKKAQKQLKIFTENILKNKTTNIITTMDLLNNKLYCFLANMSWNKKGKENHLSYTDLIKK